MKVQRLGKRQGMYICICRAIREREVDAAVRAGARRPADVFRACGKSPQCGTCACDMRQRIDDTIAREQAAAPTLLAAD
jgi:bacterioferritin-associated ferredoxin